MVTDDRRIRIITGNYGSGKTEFAINYAVEAAKVLDKVALADLDIVNVYFRSREKREELKKLGIKVISSNILEAATDLPAVSAEIFTPIRDKSYSYVIDLGGNDVGTNVLGRFKSSLDLSEVDFFMVVNVNRPDTSSVFGIIDQMEKIQFSSGIKVTGFINNTNLVRETNLENIIMGNKILSRVSEITKIPIKYTSYVKELIDCIPQGDVLGEIMPLKFYMREEWM